jgi:YidC/Oxa1 family membrane protein insertase
MDRTSRIGLLICLLLFVGVEYTLEKLYPPQPPKPAGTPASTALTAASPATTPALTGGGETAKLTTAPSPQVAEELTTLENDAIKVTLTNQGAAIKSVELKEHKADNGGNIVLNEQSHSNVLALTGWMGADSLGFQKLPTSTPDQLIYAAVLPNGLKWQRTYAFGQNPERDAGMSGYLRVAFHKIARHLGQPETKPLVYTLDITDTLTNPGATDVTLPAYTLSVGRAEPLYDTNTLGGPRHALSSNIQYLGSGWLASKFHLTTVNDFNPGSIPIIGYKTREGKDEFSSQTMDPTPLHWLGVENQFFAVLLTPGSDRLIQQGQFQTFNQRDPNGYILNNQDPDVEAAAGFAGITVPAGQSVGVGYNLYAGPKDFNRLDALGADQGELMNYGWFELLIVPMLTVLHFWYLIFRNYGVAIILLTLMIKGITWPLQSFANHSGKRMQALAPKLKELQAKHKEQPEKLQTETFAMYREYGVNPFGGCLPALIQMPVFFSLYFMLQNAVELRGQSFLWVHDLTKPDTVLTLPFLFFGFHPALHPLPIMVTLLTVVMMRMTPQIGDPQQAKIAQFMPVVFLVIFYNFAAALSLYYVINNCVSIVQIYRNLRKPLPELKRVPKKKT